MQRDYLKTVCTVLFCFALSARIVSAQEQGRLSTFSCAGGIARVELSGQVLDCFWNMGEPITEEFGTRPGFDASKKRLTQGFEQGEGFIVDELHNRPESSSAYTVEIFPNPTRGVLRIRLSNERNLKYNIALYTLRGECLRRQTGLKAGLHAIDLSGMGDAVYLLEISAGRNASVRTWRILKVS